MGVILYELLAARLPYPISQKIHEAVQAIREEDPAKLSSVDRRYRGDIETIAAKALEKDKARRYGSAAELASDIRRYLTDEPIVARPASATYQLQKFARRHRVVVTAAAVVLVVLVAGVVVSTWQAIRASRAERAAVTERDRAVAAEQQTRQERDRATAAEQVATKAEQTATNERDKAIAERSRADSQAAVANERRLITIWRSLARESSRDADSRLDDDRTALLAVQALRIHARTPHQPRYAVEEALQQAIGLTRWSHLLVVQ
jgi:hypothetical protein